MKILNLRKLKNKYKRLKINYVLGAFEVRVMKK